MLAPVLATNPSISLNFVITIRYRGAASHYMDLAHVSSCSQDSPLLAMVLLENAQLTSDTLQIAKLQLSQKGQQRTSPLPPVHNPRWKSHLNVCNELLAMGNTLHVQEDGTRTISSI